MLLSRTQCSTLSFSACWLRSGDIIACLPSHQSSFQGNRLSRVCSCDKNSRSSFFGLTRGLCLKASPQLNMTNEISLLKPLGKSRFDIKFLVPDPAEAWPGPLDMLCGNAVMSSRSARLASSANSLIDCGHRQVIRERTHVDTARMRQAVSHSVLAAYCRCCHRCFLLRKTHHNNRLFVLHVV